MGLTGTWNQPNEIVDSDDESISSVGSGEPFQHDSDQEMDSDDEDAPEGDGNKENQVILQEDKVYYSTMSETFGNDVETIIQTTDNQTIEEPLIKPNIEKKHKIEESRLPKTKYSKEYLIELLKLPSKVRNVSFVGSLKSGKTSFLDTLILQSHELKKISKNQKNYKKLRYTDNETLEIERGLTIKLSPMTLLLPNLKSSSLVLNIIDTPGHVNFLDEVSVAQRLTDISVVIVDAVERLTVGARKAIDNALNNNVQLAFVINKIDRLILELKLPLQDSYHKLRNVIDEINTYIQENSFGDNYNHDKIFSPDLNNITFASSDLNFSFTLKSFATLYVERLGLPVDPVLFAKRLWGDIYYNEETRKFSSKGSKRSFISFILEPLYKIITQVLTEEPELLQKTLYQDFNVGLPKLFLRSDPQTLLKETFKTIFGGAFGFVDMIENLNSPIEHSKTNTYSGPNGKLKDEILLASSEGPLVAQVGKIIEDTIALVRIISGTINKNDKVKILGQQYNDDDEDVQVLEIDELWLGCGRYKIPIESAPAGSIVLIKGVELSSKACTIVGNDIKEDVYTLKPIDYLNKAVFQVVVAPQVPSELPKMLDGLRKINKYYCGVELKVEDSGEHVIFGSGELYLDCLLHDLRKITEINIKVSDPITKFSETVVENSLTKVSIKSQNSQNEITIIAEPLEDKLAIDVENNKFQNVKRLNKILREVYDWDSLAARSLWTFGPESNGPNALLDDTLSDEVDKDLLQSVKNSIIQGFQWAVREGPLTDSAIRNVKFKIIDIKLAKDSLQRVNGQIIPMVRKACYASIMTATPRIMEPLYAIEIISTSQTVQIIENLLDKRRGLVLKDSPIGATQLYKIHGLVPVIDSVGLETDIRVITQGQALVSLYFDKWSVVPGDPLDKDLFIPKLRPAHINGLSRDFVMKTRKRKGLTGEPSLGKYIDKELVDQLKELGILI
ncbi:Elongation factor G [Wickerhamomyces ciferrii]|uniref:Elongation factor G n=1 Tax=Wickerhamomyces ciferrii (strain ATCC 14091 / BCRC 22168 / CBS 111 / JCM 3599 / NBRC 0793 / NRRL Y-1031 F-60-10) TaxID=1206466 RepID=K0KQ00_WICCF|nr:Elongation factor G [Wickerhamomyces ciferrii]CCH43514.1 Elongation factor G [Wickerhamomyces ciferrii]